MISRRRTIWSNVPGGLPCHVPSARLSNCQTNCALHARKPLTRARSTPQGTGLPLPYRFAGRQAGQPLQPGHRRRSSAAIATPWRAGADCFSVHGLERPQDAPRSGRPGAFPPEERLSVITLASSKTAEHNGPNSSWTLDELAFTLVNQQANQNHFLRRLEGGNAAGSPGLPARTNQRGSAGLCA